MEPEPEAIVARLWPGRDARLEPLGGGITNRNFKVTVTGEAFVLRIGGKDTELLGIDRHAENAASRIAAELGLAPEVVGFVEPDGYLVTRFVEGEVGRVDVEQVGRALARLHAGPAFPARFDSFRVVEVYRATALERGMIYLSSLICNLAVVRARLRGWPRMAAPFSLGRWGLPVTLLGIAWGGGMLINFAWPRAATNPTPKETNLLLNFHWGWLNHRPVLWTVAIVIAAVGAVYFVLVQRTKPAHLQAPEGEVYAVEAPEVPAPGTT